MSSAPTNESVLTRVRVHPDLLSTLHPLEFEQLVSELLKQFGWKVESSGNAIGFDFAAVSEVDPGIALTWVVECKLMRSARPVGLEEVRNLYGAKLETGSSNAMLITNSRFTPSAKAFAETKSDLHLIDHDQVLGWLAKS